MPEFCCDLSLAPTEFKHFWQFCVGSGHATLASRVGGPATAQNQWLAELLEFCQREKLALDFLSTHHYPNDPPFERMAPDTEGQLAAAPRSSLRQQTQDAHRQAGGRPLIYTEWNSSSDARDPLHDESYAAAFIVKTIMEASGLVEGIDEDHVNPRRAWVEMKRPNYLSDSQIERLECASALKQESLRVRYHDRVISIDLELPPQAVAAVKIKFT